jgi:hypothetical protein
VPSAPNPDDGATDVDVDTTLSWTCSDPDNDPLTYDIQMRSGMDPWSSIGSDLGANSIDVTSLTYSTEYEWQVAAKDDKGNITDGPIWHFVTKDDPTYQGVYAELTIHRKRTFDGSVLTRNDYLSARFDSVYAPDGPDTPLRPNSVTCTQVGASAGRELVWSDSWNWFYYDNIVAGYFLGPGAEYFFTITAGDGVPSLVTDPIVFPECGPHITSPAAFSFVTLEGLELVWTNYDSYPDCSRPVTIRIEDLGMMEWTDVYIETENDGSYTFTARDAALIDPSVYQLQIVLIIDNKENIIATGYDPRSWVWARAYATQIVYKQ